MKGINDLGPMHETALLFHTRYRKLMIPETISLLMHPVIRKSIPNGSGIIIPCIVRNGLGIGTVFCFRALRCIIAGANDKEDK